LRYTRAGRRTRAGSAPGSGGLAGDSAMGSGQGGGAGAEQFQAEVLRQFRSTYGPAVLEGEEGAAALYSMPGQVGLFARRCRNPVLAAGIGGVGPKPQLARDPAEHESVGLSLAAACVNEVLARGALPLFLVHRLATGEPDPAVALQVLRGIAAGCRQADCALLGGMTDVRPGACAPGPYDLTGFVVGMVERERLLHGPQKVRPGDVLVGIESAGLHGSGDAWVRQTLLGARPAQLDEVLLELRRPLREELLRPARVYAKAVRAVLERYRVKGVVHGLAHVGNGGLLPGLQRAMGRRCVARLDRAALPSQPVFAVVQRLGGLGDDEMRRTFNLGVGMVAIVAPFYADAAVRRIRRAGERAAVIGQVVQGDGPAAELG